MAPYKPGGNLPLPLTTYVAMELPPHIYVEALRDGDFSQDNWSYLLIHASSIMHLAISRKATEMQQVASNFIWALRSIGIRHVKDPSVWEASEEELRTLETSLTVMGSFYKKVPRSQIHEARVVAATRAIEVASEVLASEGAV